MYTICIILLLAQIVTECGPASLATDLLYRKRISDSPVTFLTNIIKVVL